MPLSLERKTTPVPFATHVRRPLPAPGAREGLRVLIASHSSAQRHPTLAWFLGEPHNARLCDTLESFIAGLTAPQAIDLAVVDCALTESDCMAGLRVVRQRRPHLPVIVLCRQTCCSRRTAVSLLQEGATGLLPWEMPPHLIDAALPLMMDGQRFAPPDLLVDLAAPGDVGAAAASEMRPAPDPREALTRLHFSPRECDVAVYLAQGYANKEIAHRLSIQEVTVKVYASSIYRKLGVRNRTQAAARLLAQGVG
ncbi:MAG: hypothetical protein GVY13_12440 [Alphaproteobacteria bacterium]|jgi:DNA-binding NarL/FixJ family response regulator|nr:hypothetical protein [Alphaproteobacteria bacterium]